MHYRVSICLSYVGLCLLIVLSGSSSLVFAQSASSRNGRVLNLTIRHVGISIGDSERTTGIRLNDRDRRLRRANGINLTLWRPYAEADGIVNGVAVGLPLTGGTQLRGIGTGGGLSAETGMDGLFFALLGLGSGRYVRGMSVGGLGVGAGERVQGIMLGGLGAGAGSGADGLLFGGLGVGAGGTTNGVLIGGLGAGAGEQANGVLLGGVGAGAGERVNGILAGGAGAGAGEDATGLLIGGLGAGAGRRATGLLVGGLAAGAGDTLNGVGLSLLGVGAGNRIKGIAVGGAGVGSTNLTGLAVAGGYSRIDDGRLRGVSAAAYNDVRGTQHGLTIGIYNYTRQLNGVQIGLLNVARNNPQWARILPVLNLNL